MDRKLKVFEKALEWFGLVFFDLVDHVNAGHPVKFGYLWKWITLYNYRENLRISFVMDGKGGYLDVSPEGMGITPFFCGMTALLDFESEQQLNNRAYVTKVDYRPDLFARPAPQDNKKKSTHDQPEQPFIST